MPASKSVLVQLAEMPRAFWMANVMEMIERLAYYGVRVVVPIYVSQADDPGGLHFTMAQRSVIFAVWAAVQAGVPVFSGGFADRWGYKRTIALSTTITILGYVLMATQRGYLPFLLGCCTVGLGSALFKPGLQGTIACTLREGTSSVGWGTFYMVVNVGGWLGPPLAHFMHGLGWPMVFGASAGILALNYLLLLTSPEVASGAPPGASVVQVVRTTLRNLARPQLAAFILAMSGFWLVFTQFFDLMPNFIVDWTDSRALVQALHLPASFTAQTPRGAMLSQEWIINTNAALVVVLVVWVSALVARMKRVRAIFVGIALASLGLMLAGATMSGALCLLGVVVLSFGEMLASPKMNEYLGILAPAGEKGLYMGYASMPAAIGWVVGSLLGGHLYERLGEKAALAMRYLHEHGGAPSGVDRTTAMEAMQRVTGMDANAATRVLWETYHPYRVWFPIVGLGLAGAVGIWLFSRWIRRYEAADV